MSRLLPGLELEQIQMVAVPAADDIQQPDGEQRKQAEPGHIALAKRNDDRRRQQRTEGRAGITADLKSRLRQTIAPA